MGWIKDAKKDAKAAEDKVVSKKLTKRGVVAHRSAERCPESGVMRPNCPYKVRRSDPTCSC